MIQIFSYKKFSDYYKLRTGKDIKGLNMVWAKECDGKIVAKGKVIGEGIIIGQHIEEYEVLPEWCDFYENN